MAKKDIVKWKIEPPENFLNAHFLYRGVHKTLWIHWPDINRIYPNFFQLEQAASGLSVDWSKYSTPEITFSRLIPDLKIYGIAELNVGKLRECIAQNDFQLKIRDAPISNNRAHSLIEGIGKKNNAKMKIKFEKFVKWAQNMTPIK